MLDLNNAPKVKRLIITADDYGMCPSVNEAIEDCIAAGVVHSACVMASMPYCEQAKHVRLCFPKLSLGIHWTVTQGYPILGSAAVPSLVGSDGQFFSVAEFRKRSLIGKINKVELQQELTAQYLHFCELAGEPDFWNTHENVHFLPTLFRFFTKVAKELNIYITRNPVRVAPEYSFRMYVKNWLFLQNMSWARSKGMIAHGGLVYTPNMIADKTGIEEAIQQISWPENSVPLEIAIHPATQADPELFGGLQESRVKEYRYFSRPDVVDRLKALGCDLVGFGSLQTKQHK